MEIDAGLVVKRMTFSANGEYLVSGHYEGVRVWRVQDGREMANLEKVGNDEHLALSKDGNWLATGTTGNRSYWGEVIVWDANTYKQKYQWNKRLVYGLDFSPDATQLVAVSADKAIIWDLATGNEVRTLVHQGWVKAVKYSPEGDRIATVTRNHVRVWDSEDGRLLHEIQVSCSGEVSLVWGYNLLFIMSKDKVQKIEGTTVSEWSIPETDETSLCTGTALQSRGEFVVSATSRTIGFWDISTYAQLPPIRHSQDIESITLSPDDQFIAIAGKDRKITIKRLSHISVSIVPSCISTSSLCSCFCLRVAFLSMSLNTSHFLGTNHPDR